MFDSWSPIPRAWLAGRRRGGSVLGCGVDVACVHRRSGPFKHAGYGLEHRAGSRWGVSGLARSRCRFREEPFVNQGKPGELKSWSRVRTCPVVFHSVRTCPAVYYLSGLVRTRASKDGGLEGFESRGVHSLLAPRYLSKKGITRCRSSAQKKPQKLMSRRLVVRSRSNPGPESRLSATPPGLQEGDRGSSKAYWTSKLRMGRRSDHCDGPRVRGPRSAGLSALGGGWLAPLGPSDQVSSSANSLGEHSNSTRRTVLSW